MIKNVVIATIASILTAFLITLVIGLIDGFIHSPHGSGAGLSLAVALVASMIAAMAVLFWAIPLHFIFVKFNRAAFSWYMFAAIIPTFGFIYALKPFGQDSASDVMMQAAFCSFIAFVSAFVFWYIAVARAKGIK